jgi:hypothetical protein
VNQNQLNGGISMKMLMIVSVLWSACTFSATSFAGAWTKDSGGEYHWSSTAPTASNASALGYSGINAYDNVITVERPANNSNKFIITLTNGKIGVYEISPPKNTEAKIYYLPRYSTSRSNYYVYSVPSYVKKTYLNTSTGGRPYDPYSSERYVVWKTKQVLYWSDGTYTKPGLYSN